MKQTSFFDPAPEPPFQAHSETSREAALALAGNADTYRRRVFDHLETCGEAGATDEEMQNALGMAANTQRPRRVELWRAGLIKDSGRRRQTRSRRQAVVWVAVDQLVPALRPVLF